MRLPYIPNPPQPSDSQDQAIVERIKQRRGQAGLLALDLTLLHSPPVADGWNSFLASIRTRTSLPASIRELAICRVAALNRAEYEWEHHVPILAQSGAVSDAGIEYVRSAAAYGHMSLSEHKSWSEYGHDGTSWNVEGHGHGFGVRMRGEGIQLVSEGGDGATGQQEETSSGVPTDETPEAHGLDEKHLAVLAYTDCMTMNIKVPDEVFQRLKTQFSDREVVEITATVAAYNCVSRFLVALDVGEMNDSGGVAGQDSTKKFK